MKKLVIVAAMASLSACGGAASEEAAPAEPMEMMAEEAPAPTAADGGASVGMFRVINAAGETSMEDIKADGTYTSTSADGEVSTGVWEQRSPNEFCSQPSDEDAMTCYAETINEDGVWVSTDPNDGEVSTVERVEAEAATAEG